MKTNILIKCTCNLFALFLLPYSLVFSQTAWLWQNPLPTGNALTAATYTNESVLVTVGEEGTVLITSDNGMSWEIQTNAGHTSAKLNAVSFVDNNIGVVVGDSGKILKTTDKGVHWIQLNSGTGESLRGVDMVDLNNIFAVGNSGTLLLSTDGGSNWTSQTITPSRQINGVSFANIHLGILVGNGGLLMRSTDGGITWDNLSVTSNNLTAIEFVDSVSAIIVGQYYNYPTAYTSIYRTTDSGVSWSLQKTLFGTLGYVTFGSRETGFVGGDNIFKTTDGGVTWDAITNSPTTLTGIMFFDPTTGVCLQGRRILSTTDGGNTWLNRSSDNINIRPISSVSFFTPFNGYIVGGIDSYGNALAASTSDGGITWVRRTCGWTDNRILRSVSAASISTAFAIGDYPYCVFKTNDGGLSWMTTYTYVGDTYWYGISFCDENNGIAVGTNGKIIRTTNGGTTWSQQSSGTVAWLWDVTQVTTNIAWAVGEAGTILHTTNGGLSWFVQESNSSDFIVAISALNIDNAFAVTRPPATLLRTNNGGQTWESIPIPNNPYLNAIAAIDSQKAIVIGDGGIILKTTDAGDSWINLPSGTNDNLWDVSFVDRNVGTVVGYFATVLRTSNGGINWVDNELLNNVPTTSALSQNYPNPFNPSTTISFSLPLRSFVSLKVYDLTGREVTTIVSEEMSAGNYSRQWNPSNLASGIYFYRLQAGSYTETKKLVLLK